MGHESASFWLVDLRKQLGSNAYISWLKKVPVLKNLMFCLMVSQSWKVPWSQPTWSQNAPAILVSHWPPLVVGDERLTLDECCIYTTGPNIMADDRNVVADCRCVEEIRADELVAKESGLILVSHKPFWCRVAAGRDEGGERNDDADDGRGEVHLDRDSLCTILKDQRGVVGGREVEEGVGGGQDRGINM